MTVPAGETCKLRYAWRGAVGKEPGEGDVLKTSTGRRYVILEITGGEREYVRPGAVRWLSAMHLKVLVMAPEDETPLGARVYEFNWDKREKKNV